MGQHLSCFLQGGGHGWEARITILAPPFLPLPEVLHDHKAQFKSKPAGAASIIPSSQVMCTVVREGGVAGAWVLWTLPQQGQIQHAGCPCVNTEQITSPLAGWHCGRQRLPTTLGPTGTRPPELLPERSVTASPGRSVHVCVHMCTNSPKYYSITKLGCSNHNFLASFSV